ncbi:MAG: Dihydrofolate reductase [Microbacteriaceae bacterium]|nr:Dihydrofolate reductase [Microbacteriaceae bacterium]
MAQVISNASVSLDGYIAYDDNSIGDLFEWYDNGDVEVVNKGDLPAFHLTRVSADYWASWTQSLGALVVGRTLFDVTDGWRGEHPLGVPVVVLTHEPPTDWSYAGSENFYFVTEGIEAAVAKAADIAGEQTVAVAAGTITGQALAAGLLDAVNMDVVPLVLGSGKPFFGSTPLDTVRLGDPVTVVQGRRVTHLQFPVLRG